MAEVLHRYRDREGAQHYLGSRACRLRSVECPCCGVHGVERALDVEVDEESLARR
jgi:hypothetical protein